MCWRGKPLPPSQILSISCFDSARYAKDGLQSTPGKGVLRRFLRAGELRAFGGHSEAKNRKLLSTLRLHANVQEKPGGWIRVRSRADCLRRLGGGWPYIDCAPSEGNSLQSAGRGPAILFGRWDGASGDGGVSLAAPGLFGAGNCSRRAKWVEGVDGVVGLKDGSSFADLRGHIRNSRNFLIGDQPDLIWAHGAFCLGLDAKGDGKRRQPVPILPQLRVETEIQVQVFDGLV